MLSDRNVEHVFGEAKPDGEKPYSTGPYHVEGGRIVRLRQTKEGPIVDPLCNFNAQVKEEILLDDGAEVTRAFLIEGQLDTGLNLRSVRIPASRFAGMTWVTEVWGLRAVVRAGQAMRDCLREAIQRLSPNPRLRQIFTHTGWREISGKWVYLSASATGNDEFEVDLGSELSRYKIPSTVENPVEAMRDSLKLLEVARLRITAPLWAACYRAPLVTAFPQDLSLWLEGRTGSLKSTLAALFLSHFGDFDRIHLPGAWSSTANQLERRAFLLKDSLFVVDDYAPMALDRREMETKAARLLRSQGNLSGRGRLKADLSERSAFPPRGIVISTGEQHPPGQSLSARTLLIEIDRPDIKMDRLTQAQERSGRLSHAMAGYISWLAPQMGDMAQLLRKTFEGTRAKASETNNHLRIPESASHLWLGLHSGLLYAEEIGALGADKAADLREKCWDAFLDLGREQGRVVEGEQPTRRFLEVLQTIIAQGRAILLPKGEEWIEPKPGVDFLGWRDDEFLYLLSEAVFSAVVRFCRDTEEHFPIRQDRLRRDLAKEEISECDPGRFTAVVKIGGDPKRVLKLIIKRIENLLDDKMANAVTTGYHSYRSREVERDGL